MTPSPGFAGSPLREGAGAVRRGSSLRVFAQPVFVPLRSAPRADLAPPLGELSSEARLWGSSGWYLEWRLGMADAKSESERSARAAAPSAWAAAAEEAAGKRRTATRSDE